MEEILDLIALILVIIGGINWGLVGLVNFNLVQAIIGVGIITSILYTLVGVAALYMIYIATRR